MFDTVRSMLDPELVIQEAMYGFIMALTLITTAQLGIFTYGSRWELIMAIIGMDFVWGAIDMYLFYRVDILASHRRIAKYLHLTYMTDLDEKKALLHDEFTGTMFELVSEKDRDKIMDVFLQGEFVDNAFLKRSNRHYAFNALTAFVVSILTVIPSVIALAILDDYSSALFVASLTSAVALFFMGYLMSPYVHKWARIGTGSITAIAALALTLFAAYFGG